MQIVLFTCNFDMEKFLKNIFLYFLTVGLLLLAYFWLGAYVAEIAYGLNTRKQILISFSNADSRQYNKMFLGNSRVYRGINPDKIDDHTYNFAHDNDTYNQCYYKLQHVLANGKKIDSLFLGADYFQFSIKSDTRNYIYDYLFDAAYYLDYSDSYWEEFLCNCQQVFFNNQTLLLKSVARIVKHENTKGYIKDNGQYVFDSKASPNDKVKRKTDILDIQREYYERIIDLCHENNIQVTVFTMPVRDGEMESYTKEDINRFHQVVTTPLSSRDSYVDMTYLEEFRNYKDYTDITHLNSKAADRFTKYFYKRIQNKE